MLRPEIIKLLEENTQENLYYTILGNDLLDRIPKARTTQQSFYSAKETFSEMRRKLANCI